MKTKILIVALALAFLAGCGGCATRGGWPCWAWSARTDQKDEAAAKAYLAAQKTNSVPKTSQQ